ncbi:MAG: amidohydrolase family protein [Proteobacteria bacterium]|nr:amidohydrolase family protein [Pseudomonadota bacterium]
MTDLKRPTLKTPPGACDTHMHIYEPGYPMAQTATLAAPDAPLSKYLEVKKRLGLERTVIVQPTTYGTDNRCTLEAMAKLGDSARGVVAVDTTVTDEELQALTDKGVRGIRCHMLPGGALPWEIMDEMAARVNAFGWHLQLQMDGSEFPDRLDHLLTLPCPIVIDHTGRFHNPVPPDHEAFKALLRLVDNGAWVKLSGPNIVSKTGRPEYQDVGLLAKALVAASPDHMVWASNWPHPGEIPPPDEGALLDLLLDWVEDDATRNRILADNAAELYGF